MCSSLDRDENGGDKGQDSAFMRKLTARETLLSFFRVLFYKRYSNNIQYNIDMDYNYYGVFLLSHEATRLLRLCMKHIEDAKVDITDWKLVCNHCTILHKRHKNQEIRKYLDLAVGNVVEFTVTGIGFSDKAIAVSVDLPSENKVSHITIAVAPGHRPVESNDIVNWVTFSDERPSFIGILDKR